MTLIKREEIKQGWFHWYKDGNQIVKVELRLKGDSIMATTKEFSIYYLENGEWKNGGTVYAKTFRDAKELAKKKFPKAKDYDVVLLKEFLK